MTLSRRGFLSAAASLPIGACATMPSRRAYPRIGRILRVDPALDGLVPPGAVVEKLADGLTWSEGPAWVGDAGGYLLFSDVPENRMHRWSEAEGLSTFMAPSGLAGPADPALREAGSNGLLADGPGHVLMADSGSRTIARLDLTTKAKTVLAERYGGKRFNSPNDLVKGPDGAIFFTDPPYGLKDDDRSAVKEQPSNGVYRLEQDGKVTLLEDELTRPNGIGLSPDGRTLYVSVSDPARAVILAYDVDTHGAVSGRRVLKDFTEQVGDDRPGLPDGMAVHPSGALFATGPGGIHVLTPDGASLGLIQTGSAAANCTFGGAGGSTLFITSAAILARVRLR